MITLNTFISMDRTLIQIVLSRDEQGLTVKETIDILKDYIISLEGDIKNEGTDNSIHGENAQWEDRSNQDPNGTSGAV